MIIIIVVALVTHSLQRTSIQQTQTVTPQKRLNVVEIVEWGTSGNRLQSKIV